MLLGISRKYPSVLQGFMPKHHTVQKKIYSLAQKCSLNLKVDLQKKHSEKKRFFSHPNIGMI